MDIEIKIVKVCLAVELIPYIMYVRAYWRRLKISNNEEETIWLE